MADYPISKEAVIKELVELRETLGNSYASIVVGMAIDRLNGFPKFETPAPEWISVEERLPEEYQDALVWAVYHDEDGRSWGLEEIDRYCEACGWDNTADAEAREVTHWMPKHAPPKQGG